MRCQQFYPTHFTALISALFDISTAAPSTKRSSEDTTAAFVQRVLCPFDCVPQKLDRWRDKEGDINRSMWLTIPVPRPRGPQSTDSKQAWCAAASAHVPHGIPSCLPPQDNFWLNLSSAPQVLGSHFSLFHIWHWPCCDIAPSGHCGITQICDESNSEAGHHDYTQNTHHFELSPPHFVFAAVGEQSGQRQRSVLLIRSSHLLRQQQPYNSMGCTSNAAYLTNWVPCASLLCFTWNRCWLFAVCNTQRLWSW